jgi:hypothetical protein
MLVVSARGREKRTLLASVAFTGVSVRCLPFVVVLSSPRGLPVIVMGVVVPVVVGLHARLLRTSPPAEGGGRQLVKFREPTTRRREPGDQNDQ